MKLSSSITMIALALRQANTAPTDYGLTGITFINQNPNLIYISGDWAAKDGYGSTQSASLDRTIESGASTFYPGCASCSPKFMVSTSPSSLDTGEKRNYDTAVELTWNGFEGKTFYDVDVERGVSVPIWCHANTETWSQGQGCVGNVLDDCPSSLVHIDSTTGLPDQCRADGTAEDIARRREKCPTAYVESEDVRTNTMSTGNGE